MVKSPAQAAADTEAPPAGILTAPVEYRVLEDSVILRGTVTAAKTVDISPGVSGGAEGARPLVTKLPVRAGDRVSPGQVVLEVSGRPVFVLDGDVPAYRDLKPGTQGDDVAQLQRALASLGHTVTGDTPGTFGSGTKTALAAFYQSIGYSPVPASDDEKTEIESAQEAVTAAIRAYEDAQRALDRARRAPAPAPPATENATDGKGTTDQGSPDGPGTVTHEPGAGATSGINGPADDATPAVTGTSTAGGKSGAAGLEAVGQEGGELEDLQTAVDRAREDLDKARDRFAEAQEVAGPMLPSSEVAFVSAFPARVDRVMAAVGSAVTGSAMTLSAGHLVVRGYLQDGQKELVRKGQRVSILDDVTGYSVPGKVDSVADTKVSPAQADASGGDIAWGGDGGMQGSQGGTSTVEVPNGYLLAVRPDKAVPARLTGQEVRITVEAASTEDKALVVPVTALSSDAGGRSVVTVVDDGGGQHRVAVRPGTSGDGYVAVTPFGASLREGDKVLTGVAGGETAGEPR
jgi:hypothetical protein